MLSQIIDINSEQLETIVEKGKPVLLLIWIKSCDQCRRFKPIYSQLPDYYPEVKFLRMNKFDSLENLRLTEKFEKETTPVIPVFCRGEHLGTFVGYHSLEDFTAKLNEVFRENRCIS